jgi:hypothetical protein
MNIDKDSILQMLPSKGQDAHADQAQQELTDRGGQGGQVGIGGMLGKLL